VGVGLLRIGKKDDPGSADRVIVGAERVYANSASALFHPA